MNHVRHQNIYNIPAGFSATVIGAGGIGAITALMLAKMGVRAIAMYDDDTVSEENIATQLHKVSDIGKPKVMALGATLMEYSDDVFPFGHEERIGPDSELRSTLVISAVDSILARQQIWIALCNPKSRWSFYLDSRMGAMEYQHFLVPNTVESADAYSHHLMSITDDSVPDAPCTEKATFFTAAIAAGHIGNTVREIAQGVAKPHRLVHNIPNYWLQTFSL